MGSYIDKNTLYIGDSKKHIKKNMEDLLRYIYYQFPLNHEQMKDIYEHIKVPINFDDKDDKDKRIYNDFYRYALKFMNHYKKDKNYIYQFQNEIDINNYQNKMLIYQLHTYMIKKSPNDLRLIDFKNIEFLNHTGINDDARGTRYLDWKLHFWDSYQISDKLGVTFQDLIIAAYKIKSHKFENKYEVYSGIQQMQISNDSLKIIVKYVHRAYASS